MDVIPITSLAPDAAPPQDKSIRGIITLSWPYSSSTRQCALLLADPDFRLRNRQGQVRVRFTGASAERVAKARLGIGDEVVLALEGALWEQDSEATRTPGRSVDGELMFRRKLRLEVVRQDGGTVNIEVDAAVSPPASTREEDDVMATPLPKAVAGLRTNLGGNADGLPRFTYSSPAFMKRLRLSGDAFGDSLYDPFDSTGDDDASQSREGHWISIGGVRTWRYADRSPSPKKARFEVVEVEKEHPGSEETVSLNQPKAVETLRIDTAPDTRMLPPVIPPLSTTVGQLPLGTESTIETSRDQQAGPLTPHLRPVTSPNLPLPSPFPVDARSVHQRQPESAFPPTASRQSVDTMVIEEAVQEAAPSSVQSQDEDREIPGVTAEEHEASFQDLAGPVSAQITGLDLPHEQREPDGREILGQAVVNDNHILPTELEDQPLSTPVKDANEAQLDHRDGTGAAPSSARIKPSSAERDKAMAQTFRSLFGFGTTSQTILPQEHKTPTPLPPVSYSGWGMPKAAQPRTVQIQPPIPDLPAQHDGAGDTGASLENETTEPMLEMLPVSQSTARATDVEVVDLGSSSDEEDVREHLDQQPAVLLVPQRSAPPQQTATSQDEADAEDSRPALFDLREAQAGELSSRVNFTQSELEGFASEVRQNVPDGETDRPGSVAQQSTLPPTVVDLISPSPTNERIFAFGEPEKQTFTITDGQSTALETASELPRQYQPSDSQTNIPAPAVPAAAQDTADFEAPSEGTNVPGHIEPLGLYPSLPLSPSNSQSLDDMASQALLGNVDTDTATTLLPPTPQLTQPESQGQKPEASHDRELTSQAVDLSESTELQAPLDTMPIAKAKKTPVKKRRSSRLSVVPDVISDWFSPKSSGTTPSQKSKKAKVLEDVDELSAQPTGDGVQPLGKDQTSAGVEHAKEMETVVNGLMTPISYFTPLARLERLLNPSSQQAHGGNVVDVFAVVVDETSEPVRAKQGPKDYFTIFKILDVSLPSASAVRVEVYRPWLATLPVASVGDVVLLRAFAVKSRKRQAYLLSTDASAWCVWRHANSPASVERKENVPVWVRRRSGSSAGVKEEVKGPPVELGDEERKHAERLREWWQASRPEHDLHEDQNAEHENGLTNGNATQTVAAKL